MTKYNWKIVVVNARITYAYNLIKKQHGLNRTNVTEESFVIAEITIVKPTEKKREESGKWD